jgi:hypothetical protein
MAQVVPPQYEVGQGPRNSEFGAWQQGDLGVFGSYDPKVLMVCLTWHYPKYVGVPSVA